MIYQRRLFHHETDSDGVCHFSNYLRMFEEAFSEALAALDMPQESLPHSFAVTDVTSKYHRPIRFGETFTVTLDFANVRRAFLMTQATITSDGALCATVDVKLAAVSHETGNSTAIAPALRTTLSAFKDAAE